MAIIYPWNAAFSLVPTGGDILTDGDNRIVDLKDTLASELRVEHDTLYDGATYLDTGRHKTGSARAFFQAAAPTDLLVHAAGGVWPPVAAQDDRATSSDLDDGRLWVDRDDAQPYIREQNQIAAAWSDIVTNEYGAAAAWVSLWPRMATYSDISTMDDHTLSASPTAANAREDIADISLTVDVPDDGRSYEILVRAHCTYGFDQVGTGSEIGFWLQEDINAAGPVDVREMLVGSFRWDPAYGISMEYVNDSVNNGDSHVFTIQWTSDTTTGVCINPVAGGGFFAHNAGAFAGTHSRTQLVAELRPRYGGATGAGPHY